MRISKVFGVKDDSPHNADNVHRVQILLCNGLGPFLEQEIGAEKLEDPAVDPGTEVGKLLSDKKFIGKIKGRKREKDPFRKWDCISQLDLMDHMWNPVFHKGIDDKKKNREGKFGWEVRRYVKEFKFMRNPPAHPVPDPEVPPPPVDDVYRMLDTAYRLLSAVGAEAEAAEVERRKKKFAPRLPGVKQARFRVIIISVIIAVVVVVYEVQRSKYEAQRPEQFEQFLQFLERADQRKWSEVSQQSESQQRLPRVNEVWDRGMVEPPQQFPLRLETIEKYRF